MDPWERTGAAPQGWATHLRQTVLPPPRGARTHGLPMLTDWKSLEASCCPIHTDSLCNITRRTYPLRLCYCVTKLHRCFHYDVDSDFVLHSNCRCSENVDVATDKFWPVVTMCRRCSPFPERQDDGNSSAH